MEESKRQSEPQQCQDSAQVKYIVKGKGFALGTWYEFGLDDETKVLGKLSWKSQATGRLVFTNSYNSKVRTITTQELIREIRTGRARHASSELIERSLSRIKDSARKSFRVSKGNSFKLSD